MTEEMQDRLQQLVSKHGREFTESDLIREAIRCYLDDQEDIIGSRRHFAKAFQDRVDCLEVALTFHLNVLLYLTAGGFSLDEFWKNRSLASTYPDCNHLFTLSKSTALRKPGFKHPDLLPGL